MSHHAHRFALALFASVIAASISCSTTPVQVAVQPLPEALRDSSGFPTRERLVIRDASTWSTMWPRIVGSRRPIPPVPEVDFISDAVVIAAMGTRNTGGYVIRVTDAQLRGDAATITVLEESPGAGCVVTTAETYPITVVLVPSFRGQATFVERTAQPACQ